MNMEVYDIAQGVSKTVVIFCTKYGYRPSLISIDIY